MVISIVTFPKCLQKKQAVPVLTANFTYKTITGHLKLVWFFCCTDFSVPPGKPAAGAAQYKSGNITFYVRLFHLLKATIWDQCWKLTNKRNCWKVIETKSEQIPEVRGGKLPNKQDGSLSTIVERSVIFPLRASEEIPEVRERGEKASFTPKTRWGRTL